jgi:hypothetical protein
MILIVFHEQPCCNYYGLREVTPILSGHPEMYSLDVFDGDVYELS